MNKLLFGCLVGTLSAVSLPVYAAGDVELGKAKSIYCNTCHGMDGQHEIEMFSGGTARLGGMDPQKFVAAMKAYKYGQRFHPMMQFFVFPISEKDMEDLAAYYATLGAKPK